jgi:hypothetical protein
MRISGGPALTLLALTACAHRAPIVPIAPPPPAPAIAMPPAAPASPWAAVPVRVMTWTARGNEELARLPGALPATMPARWYVEPIAPLDHARFTTLIGLVRDEHVPGLSLRGRAVASWLGELRDLPELTALVLDATDVDGASLATTALALSRLYLAHTALNDDDAIALVTRQPGLEVLDLEDTAVSDRGARAIAGLAGLHALNLSATELSDDGGAALAALAQLEIVDLGETRVAARTVAALRGLPLHELFLDHTHVGKELPSLAVLAPRLTRFDVSGTAHHFTDDELAWLTGARQLVELGVSGARLHDKLARALLALPALRALRLAETAVTLDVVRGLAARPDLEEIDLAKTPVDDATAAALLGGSRMRVLRLDGTPITDAALAGAVSPELTGLFVNDTAVTDAGLAVLDRIAPRLDSLGLGDTAVGAPTLARIARFAGLHTLVLTHVHAPAGALVQLGALPGLERLYLDGTHANGDVLAALSASRTSLRILHLASSDLTEDGLPALRALTRLEEITLGDTALRDEVADLSAWPRLRTLTLTGLALEDAALVRLAARRSLVVLDLSATDVRDPGALAALPHLRVLGLAQTRLSPSGLAAAKQLAARGVEVVR